MAGTLSAIGVFILGEAGVIDLPGQGVPFVAARRRSSSTSSSASLVSMVTEPKPAAELVGLVYSETPKDVFHDPESAGKAWYQPVPLAAVALVLVIILNIVFH